MEQPIRLQTPIKLGKYSLAIILPKEFVDKHNIKRKVPLVTKTDGDCFIVMPNEIVT